jgi:hypothetical protein
MRMAVLDLRYDALRFFCMHVDSTLLCATRCVCVCVYMLCVLGLSYDDLRFVYMYTYICTCMHIGHTYTYIQTYREQGSDDSVSSTNVSA